MPAVRAFAVVVVASLAACADQARPGGANERRPSILLVTVDTTRADRLGFAGYSPAATPRLDALAKRGTWFSQARTCVPLTLPAHGSLMTGLYPPAHGLRENGIACLGDEAVTIAEHLRGAGYRTGAFVSAFVLDAQYGLDQGFDAYDDVPRRRLVSGGFIEERPADETVDAALAWVAQAQTPFFLWVHLFDPHAPYDPPRRFAAEDPYDGEIAFADASIGRLIDAIDQRDETAVFCVTSDHGESLGEHGETTHGVFVYDATLLVPLLFAGRGVPPDRRVDVPTSIVDVAPTLLSLAKAPPLPGIHGVDLTPTFEGDAPRPRPIWFESLNGWLDHGWSPLVGVTDGRDKFIEAPRAELYDLVEDAKELSNRAVSEPERADRLRAAVRSAWDSLSRDVTLADVREIDEDERRTLEQLGYTASGDGDSKVPYPAVDMVDPKDRILGEAARNEALTLMGRARAATTPAERTRHLDRAIGILEQAIAGDPGAVLLHEYAGQCYVQKAAFMPAIDHLRRCLAKRPDRVDARYSLGVALLGSGDAPAARRELERCLEQQPTFVLAAKILAMHHEDRGDYAAAAGAWRHFLEHWEANDDERRNASDALERVLEKSRG